MTSSDATGRTPAPLDTSRPFSRAAGLRAGMGKHLRTRSYRQLLHGIYVDAAVPDSPLLWARAALVPFEPKAWPATPAPRACSAYLSHPYRANT